MTEPDIYVIRCTRCGTESFEKERRDANLVKTFIHAQSTCEASDKGHDVEIVPAVIDDYTQVQVER